MALGAVVDDHALGGITASAGARPDDLAAVALAQLRARVVDCRDAHGADRPAQGLHLRRL